MISTILLLLSLNTVNAHSWIACADYSLTASTSVYDESACLGFARGYTQFATSTFGEDRGFNYDTTLDKAPCKIPFDKFSYSHKFHQAVYRPKSRIRLIWPAKNHVADTCTNPYIPDTQLKLFYHCNGPNAYSTLRDFLKNSVQVIDWKKEGNKKGFQNCANFCANPDKAVCNQEFIMPTLPINKTCTFLWFWEFNPGSPPYTACWDISTNPNPPTPAPTSPTDCSKLWDQCGGNNWKGFTCCKEGICKFMNEWYSQCVPNVQPRPITTPPPEICPTKLWGQCGGIDFPGKPCCPPNAQCVSFNAYYFQCVPKCV
jgi:hypothetical protein